MNPVETYIRAGTYARAPEPPFVLGNDCAGVVRATGDAVSHVSPGDRVYVAGTRTGAYATATIASASNVLPLPESVTFGQGAAIGGPYATAYRALVQIAHAEAGETVLVHGASGGVGVAAVQLAVARGLTVVGTASTDEARSMVREQGATVVANHREEGAVAAAVEEATGGRGVNIIIEMLANVNLGNDLKMLARGGRVAIVGSRGDVEITPRDLMAREASVTGVGVWLATEKERAAVNAAVNAGLCNGTLRPRVGRVFSLEDACAAHVEVIEHMSGSCGKIILETSPGAAGK